MTKERKIVRVTIEGFVQGVGYRVWTQMQAHRLGVSGWVRNRQNGDVEALLAGPPDAVDALCAACWQGPAHARVADVRIEEAEQSALDFLGAASGFHFKATR